MKAEWQCKKYSAAFFLSANYSEFTKGAIPSCKRC
jgi:hypothetical protein